MLLGCAAPAEEIELDVIETQMAEIKNEPPELPLQERDTTRLINHWIQFRELLIANNSAAIKKQALSYVYCPVYNKYYNYFSGEKPVPLFFFLQAPYKDVYLNAFSKKILTAKPSFYYSEDLSKDMMRELGITDTVSQGFSIEYFTNDTINNYRIIRGHNFKFIINRQGIKFAGLLVYENGSRHLFKQMKEDSLFFPLKTINQTQEEEKNALDTIRNKRLTLNLISFQEPNLYKSITDETEKTYRFTWLRSFHIPVVIRIDKKQNKFSLTCKALFDNQGYSPNEFTWNFTKKISVPQWITFEYLLKKMDFQHLQTDLSDDGECMDGAIWILESKSVNDYHCVYRHCSGKKDFRDACLYLLKLSGLKIKKEDIY